VIAIAKSLFKESGSAAATIGAFMFTLMNLVIEIGIVICILLGWQLIVADLISGFMLIGLMAFGFVYLTPDEVIEQARENIRDENDSTVQNPRLWDGGRPRWRDSAVPALIPLDKTLFSLATRTETGYSVQ
jgi:Predicted permease